MSQLSSEFQTSVRDVLQTMLFKRITGLGRFFSSRLHLSSSEITSLRLHEVLDKLNSGDVSAVEVTRACLQNIESQAHLNAFITVTADLALQQAIESDNRRQQGKEIGKLDGIPVAAKDNFSTKGILTTCGSKMLEDYIPPFTSTVVQKLLDEGAVLIGKTNMDEFGMGLYTNQFYKYIPACHFSRGANINSYYGSVLNPWSIAEDHLKSRIPGGSSGGSASAVAAYLCYGYPFTIHSMNVINTWCFELVPLVLTLEDRFVVQHHIVVWLDINQAMAGLLVMG
jgi:hypothetical protein